MLIINDKIKELFPADNVIVFLNAHPDDETFLSSGLISELSQENRDIYLIYCAAAKVENKKTTNERQKETRAIFKQLNPDNIIFLDFCDSCFNTSNNFFKAKIDKLEQIITANLNLITKPIILVSYDENGGYGHIDHLQVHKLGRYLALKNKKIKKLYEVTINRDTFEQWISENSNKLEEKYLPQVQYWSKIYGTSEKDIDYRYILSEQKINIKKQNLSLYKTQISSSEFPLNLQDDDFSKLFGKEYLKYIL